MGQCMMAGSLVGAASALAVAPVCWVTTDFTVLAAAAGVGLVADFVGDCVARHGKVVIHRDVVLHADDELRHVYSFYAVCKSNPIARRLRQKHEWLVLESHTARYYTLQKSPATGNVMLDMRMSLRSANDIGLHTAGQPTQMGEVRLRRTDMEFDVAQRVPMAYVIAWARKEDPRWAFSTENSRHFTTRARYAINDY